VKNEEMREFLTSRRTRVTPDQAGLPKVGAMQDPAAGRAQRF